MTSRESFLKPFPADLGPHEDALAAPERRQHGMGVDSTAPLHPLSQLIRTALLYSLSGASIAAAFQFASYEKLSEFVSSNTMVATDRRTIVLSMLIAGACTCVPPIVYLLWKRSQQAVDRVARIGRAISPLMLVFMLPLFFNWRVFQSHELLCVVAGTLFGIALERTLQASFLAISWPKASGLWTTACESHPRLVRWIPRLLVGAMFIFFAVYFSYYTVLNHYRLQTQSLDLADYDNEMWNLLRGKWFKMSPALGRTGTHMSYHAEFTAYLIAPFYALRQKADTLLVIQSTICGAGVIPIYLIARRRLQSAVAGLVLGYAYIVYAPLHGPVFYDFHFLTMAPFFAGWVLYFFETGRRGWLILVWFAAMLLREDQSACLAMASLFYLISGDRPWWALGGGILSAVFFGLIKFVIMPAHAAQGAGDESFTWIFAGLIPKGEQGFGAVLKTVATNPIYTLNTLIAQDKFVYLMKMLSPVLFLPLRHSRAWLLLVPASLFTILSTGYSPTIETYFQYTSNWTAYLFVGVAVTLASWKHRPGGKLRIAAALAAIAVTSTAMSYNHGAIFQHNTFRGGFRNVVFVKDPASVKNHNDLYALIALIPPKASVAATETEAPHVSNREDCFTMRIGYDNADYLLAAIGEASSGASHTVMVSAIGTGEYGLVETRGGYQLWRKGHSKDRNAEGKRQIGIP